MVYPVICKYNFKLANPNNQCSFDKKYHYKVVNFLEKDTEPRMRKDTDSMIKPTLIREDLDENLDGELDEPLIIGGGDPNLSPDAGKPMI